MKTIKMTALAATLGLMSISFNAAAADKDQTVSVTEISSATAFELAQGAVNQCKAQGYKVSATVVDMSGNVLAQLRENGAGIHTLESSRKKAFTVISMKRPTGDLLTLIADKPIIPIEFYNYAIALVI